MKIIFENLEKSFGTYVIASKILVDEKSRYQHIMVLENEKYGKTLRLDKAFQTSEYDEYMYHEPLVQVAMCSHPNPRKVLIIGGGDGGALEEVLKHSTVEKAVMVELDEKVIEVSKKYLGKINRNAFEDERVELLIGDGIKYINECEMEFDVVVLDLTDPYSISSYLYTDEFYDKIRRRLLNGKGILSLHVEMPYVLENIHLRVVKTLKSVFRHVRVFYNFVPIYGTVIGFANCSDSIDVKNVSEEEVRERLERRGVGNLEVYGPEMHGALLSIPKKTERKFEREGVRIIGKDSIIEDYDELNKNDVGKMLRDREV